jgi:hypothetical protein
MPSTHRFYSHFTNAAFANEDDNILTVLSQLSAAVLTAAFICRIPVCTAIWTTAALSVKDFSEIKLVRHFTSCDDWIS